jgi:hypothetical protein
MTSLAQYRTRAPKGVFIYHSDMALAVPPLALGAL